VPLFDEVNKCVWVLFHKVSSGAHREGGGGNEKSMSHLYRVTMYTEMYAMLMEPPPETGKHPWWCCCTGIFLFPGRAAYTLEVSVDKWSMFIVHGPSVGWN